jgi:hypothetical protein
METEPERNIRLVIRILRYVGWPFAILFVAMAGLGILLAPFLAFAGRGSLGVAAVTALTFLPFALFFIWLLRLTNRMAQRDPTAKSAATNVSSIMVLGFPLLTVVGIICVYKIRHFYDEYCEERCKHPLS